MGVGDGTKDWSGDAGSDKNDNSGGAFDAGACRVPEISAEERAPAQRMARLIRTIEGEIVPRLVISQRLTRPSEALAPRAPRVPDANDVSELVRLLLHHEVTVASAFAETIRQRGATPDMICLNLLAPAARELGILWEQDECDFMQVTVGLCRLHQLLRELSPVFVSYDQDHEAHKADRTILLATCPGDQHTFGIALVAQFLRRAGWDVWHEFLATRAEILDVCNQHWFSVLGLSVATDSRLDDLTDTIRAVRACSRNRAIGILVGGPVLVQKPELASLVGADATAADGPQAVLRAQYIVESLGATN